MPKFSYGAKPRDRTALLLQAILDFDRENLDERLLDSLRKQGMRSERCNWRTKSPALTLLTTKACLVELSGLSTAQVTEALALLEEFAHCLERSLKSQGREQIYGQLKLWSTEPDLNRLYFNQVWDQQRRAKGLPPLDPNYAGSEPGFQTSPESQLPPPNSPPPNSEPPPHSESANEPSEGAESSEEAEPSSTEATEPSEHAWEEIFDRVASLLKDSLPHSPAFRILSKFFGVDPQAHIKPADRQNLIIRVEKTWLHQYLPNALNQQPMLLLELENQRSLLAQYRNILWENPQAFNRPRLLPPDTCIIDQFNAIRPLRRLLILGAPGSGKTIALLELLKDLIDDAKEDASQPIPVVFNLSSYGLPPEGRDFTNWLTAQLEAQYNLHKSRARRFVESEKLLLLLDGLDEVRADLRPVCIRKINEFLQTRDRTECVVCSRFIEYNTAFEKLQLEASLKLQPLNSRQAVEYLERLPQRLNLQGLIQAIQQHEDFQQLAETPLMLNVMAVAYQNLEPSDLLHFESLEDHRRYLYDVLINRLLNRKRTVDGHLLPTARAGEYLYSQQEMLDWLIWLAKHMSDREQTVFFIEQLQPDWLDTMRQQRGYRLNSSALMGAVVGVISGCHMVPMAGWQFTGAVTFVFLPLLTISVSGVVLSSFVFVGLRRVMPQILAGFMAASGYILFFGLLAHPFLRLGPDNTYLARLSPIFMDWLGISLFWALMRDRIVVVHRVIWSWLNAFRFIGVSIAAYGAIYFPIRFFIFNKYSGDDWLNILYEPLLTLGFGASFGGLALGNNPPVETITAPNQGIHKAIRNATLLAFTIGPIGMLAAWRYAHGDPYEFVMLAVAIGLIAAMLGGRRSGQVLIQHFVLRVMLWRNGHIPWNYARFLDFSVQRMFLRRAGGGYLFMHRSFMEHLAQKAHN